MTTLRPERHGPTWRSCNPESFEEEQTLVFCCCGVEMRFLWPRGREDVRCVGCGARYSRPEHFPTRTHLIWDVEAPTPSRLRTWLSPSRLLILALTVVAAILLGMGIALS